MKFINSKLEIHYMLLKNPVYKLKDLKAYIKGDIVKLSFIKSNLNSIFLNNLKKIIGYKRYFEILPCNKKSKIIIYYEKTDI